MPRTRRVKVWSGYVSCGADPPQWQNQYETQEVKGAYQADPGGGPAQWSVRELPWATDGVTRTPYYVNSTGGTGNWNDATGAIVSWAAGNAANSGLSVSAPEADFSFIPSLSAGNYIVFVASSTDASAVASHTAVRLILPANVDIVFVPVVNGARMRFTTAASTGQSRLVDFAADGTFVRLRRGLGNAVFAIDCNALTTTAAYGVFCFGTPGSAVTFTGTYGVEIDGPHTWIDSASGTVERPIVSFNAAASYGTVLAAPTGTPTFIFKNGAKLVGATGTNIRGVNIQHLGAGSVTLDGVDFGGSALCASVTAGVQRTIDYRGLFNVETASDGATATVNNTYGTFVPGDGGQINALRIMDCDVTATNLAHDVDNTTATSAAIRPTWFGGFNQNCTINVDGYACEVTGTDATPTGHLLLIGEDGDAQPLLFLSANTTGAGRTVTAGWDFFVVGDVGKVVEPLGASPAAGQFTITAFVSARQVTVTVDEAFAGGQTIRSFKEVGDATNGGTGGAWRIANKVNAGTITNVNTRGPGTASTTGSDYSIHGITIGGCANVALTNSTASYCGLGLLNKDTTDCTITGCAADYISGFAQALVLKGAVDSVCTGNTLQLRAGSVYDGGGIRVANNDYGVASTGSTVTGNVINVPSVSFTGTTTCGLFRRDTGCTVTMGLNEWHMEDGGSVPAQFDYDGTKRSFELYQANVTGADTDYTTP